MVRKVPAGAGFVHAVAIRTLDKQLRMTRKTPLLGALIAAS